MRSSSIPGITSLVLVNWVAIPAGIVWTSSVRGIGYGAAYLVLVLVADWLWDRITDGLMSAEAARLGSEAGLDVMAAMSEDRVPSGLATLMIIQLIGVLVIPWVGVYVTINFL